MKYIDKVYKINADGDSYISGKRVELTHVDLELIKLALIKSIELPEETLQSEFKDRFKELSAQIEDMEDVSSKGLRNIELDEKIEHEEWLKEMKRLREELNRF